MIHCEESEAVIRSVEKTAAEYFFQNSQENTRAGISF